MTGAVGLEAGPGGRRVQAGPLRLHLHEVGNGPVLVLLHGGGPGASGWSNFHQNVPALSAHFRLLVVDQPGYGGSDAPDIEEPYWVFAARALRDLLDELEVDRAHLLGNSLGGGTALRFALDYPDRADRLVLMAPAGASLSIFSPEPSEGLKLLSAFYQPPEPDRDRMATFAKVMVFDQSLLSDRLVDERYELAMTPAAREGASRVLRAVARTADVDGVQLWRRLDEVTNRTLLVWGRDDRVLPLDGSFFALKRMPDARLHVFPRCGHWAQLEHREAFDRLVVDFLTAD